MLDSQMLELIKKLQSGAASLSATKAEDGVMVIYRAKFDPETGAKLPNQVVGTISQDELLAHLAEREAEKVAISALLNNFGLELPTPERKVDKTLVQDAFVEVLGEERGVATWGWLWQQQFSGPLIIAYWLSYLQLANEGVDVNSNKMKAALQALLEMPGMDGITSVLSGEEPEDIYKLIKKAIK